MDDLHAAKRGFFSEHSDADGRVPGKIAGGKSPPMKLTPIMPTRRLEPWSSRSKAAQLWHRAMPAGVLTRSQDGQTATTFLDPEIAEAFRAFHHAAATLRVIAKCENLSRAAGQRAPKIARPLR